MTAINKITAAKLLVLINLPVLLVIAAGYQIGSAVIMKQLLQNLFGNQLLLRVKQEG